MSTAEVVPMVRKQSINATIKQIKNAWEHADEKHADAEDWYRRTGQMLISLKERVGHGNWTETLKQIGRSQRRAHELMEMARGAPAEIGRKRKRENERKNRDKGNANQRHGADLGSATDPDEPDHEEWYAEAPPEERWAYSLGNLCGDIIARAAYWDKQFPGWQDFECPSQFRKLLSEAATALASISKTVAKRDRKAG